MKHGKMMAFAGMGFELLGIILGSLYLGSEIDKKFNLKGEATAVLIILTFIGWFYHLVVLLKRFMKEDQK